LMICWGIISAVCSLFTPALLFIRCAFFSCARRSRILSRRHFLPALLVPPAGARAGVVALFMTAGTRFRCNWRPDFRLVAGLESPRRPRRPGSGCFFSKPFLQSCSVSQPGFSCGQSRPRALAFSSGKILAPADSRRRSKPRHPATSTEHPGLWFVNPRLWGFAARLFRPEHLHLRDQPLAANRPELPHCSFPIFFLGLLSTVPLFLRRRPSWS